MNTRPARNTDAEGVRRVLFGVLAEYELTADHAGVDADLDDLQGNYFARGGFFDVIEDDSGTIVGSVGLYPKENGVAELRKMYLLPDYRGRGLGRGMLNRVLEFAREHNFKRIELETSSRLTDAIALYQQNGFKPITDGHLSMRCDQSYYLDL